MGELRQLQQLLDDHRPASRRAKVLFVHVDSMLRLARGEARIRNLPGDAQIVAVASVDIGNQRGFGLRVESACFTPIPFYQPLPVITAVLEKR